MKTLGGVALLVIVAGAGATSTKGVGLQAFSWDNLGNRPKHFAVLKGRADEFAGDGFSHVWSPPPSQSVDPQGYMPGQWYDIQGAADLKAFTTSLSSHGVAPVCDIVINHRSAAAKSECNGEWIEFKNPDWGTWGVVANDAKCDNSGNMCGGSCQCGAGDTGDNFCGSPDVDHSNQQVQSDIIAFLKWLKENYKFAGWRFDMASGYSGEFIKKYVEASGGDFAVGEFWKTDVNEVQGWVSASDQHAFDFPLRFALKDAIASGDFGRLFQLGLAGVNAEHSCTFLDNHDTARGSGQGGGDGGFGNDYQVMLGYVYILTHPAFPWVFIDHLDGNNGADIKKLVKLRVSLGISPSDPLYVAEHDNDAYAAYIGSSTECQGKLAMKVGPSMAWSPCGSGWTVTASGNNWAVWTKAAEIVV